jgi:hypothetical protein
MLYYLFSKLALSVVNYYSLLLVYYGYHRLIHLPIAGPLYQMHMIGHHKRDFPIRRLRAYSYSSDGSGGWFQTGGELVFGVPVLLLSYLMYNMCALDNFIVFVIVLCVVVFMGEFAHSSYHLYPEANSHPESLWLHKWLCKQQIFYKYRFLHDIHHAKACANFGFADFTMDKLFCTYVELPPNHLTIITNLQNSE